MTAKYRVFANGELLTAQKVNDYLMRQAIIHVDSQSERDALATPLGLTVWRNDKGWAEKYMPAYDATTAPAGCSIAGAGLAGWYPVMNGPRVAVARVAAQSIPASAFTALSWDTRFFANASQWGGTGSNPTRLVAPVAGDYRVSAQVGLATVPSSARILIRLDKNGAAIKVGAGATFNTTSGGVGLSEVVRLAAGDYLELKVWQDTSGAVNTDGNPQGLPRMSMDYAGAPTGPSTAQ